MADKKNDLPNSGGAKPASPRATGTAGKAPMAKPATGTVRTAPAAKPATTGTARTAPAAKPATTGTARTAPAAKPATGTARTAPAAKPATTGTARTTPAAKPATMSAARTTPAAKPATGTARTTPAAKSATTSAAGKPDSKQAATRRAASVNVKADGENKAKSKARTEKGGASKAKSAGGGAAAKAQDPNKKKRILILAGIALLCVIIIVTTVCVAVSCSLRKEGGEAFRNPYVTKTKVGYYSEYLGTVERKIPKEVKDEGRSSVGYPTYGSTLKDTIGITDDKVALRNAIIGESSYLTSVNTWNGGGGGYNRMDANGYLYNKEEPTLDANGNHRQLYKHTGSVGLYLGDVADDEPGIVKRLTLKPRGYTSYSITGLYAPAGEVVKVEISEEDMKAVGELVFHVGQALYNGKANNIWTAKNAMNRMPVIMNTLVINPSTATLKDGVYTGYIGSFVGGPIYVRNTNSAFTLTVSGAVKYKHFILGYTTSEEFEDNAKSSAPMFDLEVWETGVLHSGPKRYAEAFSYEDLYKAAVLWDKIALTSNQIRRQGIVFLYDPFVAAGAAVAFPGQMSVNCPLGWMANSLNYKSFVNSGAWGNMHEYNHNFQGFGLGGGGEVTNNAVTLVEYSLFTRISAARKAGASGDGMGGWNRYTSATFALDQITAKKFENGRYGLAGYATVLHSFGQKNFIDMARNSGGQSPDKWLKSTTSVSHNNFTYYIRNMLGLETSDDALTDEQKAYPMYVPVASTYQTGVSYMYDGEKKYASTMQPYVIERDEPYHFNFFEYGTTHEINGRDVIGSFVIPEGFSYTVKSVSEPAHGSIEKTADNYYTYTPSGGDRSGEIYVTIGITKDDGAFTVGDVELVIEFEPQIGKPNQIDQTTYTYSADTIFKTVEEAYEKQFAGFAEKEHSYVNYPSKNMNGNAQVWFPADNTVTVLQGKIHIDEDAKYRFDLRATYSNLYISLDGGKNYSLAVNVKSYVKNHNQTTNIQDGCKYYVDYDLKKDDWVHFIIVTLNNKAVLDADPLSKGRSYADLGMGKFEIPGGTIDDDTNVDDYVPPEPTVSTAIVTTAYRSSYEPPTGMFETDYFYTRDYTYTYTKTDTYADGQTVKLTNYEPWTKNVEEGLYDISHLFDGKPDTDIHTHQDFWVSENNPFVVVADVGKEITATAFVLRGYSAKNSGNIGMPTAFSLDASSDGETFRKIGEWSGLGRKGKLVSVKLEQPETFRYYRIAVTASDNGRVALSGMEFSNVMTLSNGKHYAPDADMFKYNGKWTTQSVLSNFGHVYVGNKKATVTFEFEGTRLGLFSAKGTGMYTVYIDGKEQTKVSLGGDTRYDELSYLSGELGAGKHSVKLVLDKGANLDSVVVW